MPRDLKALVDRQIRRSELMRRAAPVPPDPCIALSRAPGSGAGELGQRVAARLGYEFFGIEIVDRIAQTSHVRRQLVEALDERVRVSLDRYTADCFRDAVFRESDYARALVYTVASIGEHGGAVILGRGSCYILPVERTLRVLITADRDERVARFARTRELSAEEASHRLAREEHDRNDFLRHNFKVEPDDPSLYDLSLNTTTLGMEGAEELLLRAFERRFGETGRAVVHE